MLTQQEKIEYIKENREAAQASVTAYLDAIYELNEKYMDENGNLKEGLTPDEKVENFIKSLRSDAEKFESLRRKLIDSDFNLSLTEISRIGLAFLFMREQMEKQVTTLNKGIVQANLLIEKLLDKTTENIDFSQD